ncbi:hypothetical protein BO70DRAFT_365005 [Aspergillus heteromorphus CBS 117.55]|uniref:Uncharacterized protein n=1 Tax=Aspergillus heteromorphus CBS 117.55 TaxID=1448321 RepID=A0A317VB94_9EURO|nr:uncharacterized protein BO70DRAFT_365005 [Aspergillus heteromorphus CBS 117.55]PWY71623.1 hypothetical protein BO70DRAFT_365005 [Aspergillus heteromorphus CBS 117.55]
MATEVIVTAEEGVIPLCWKGINGIPTNRTIQVEDIINDPSAYIFVFHNFYHLWCAFHHQHVYQAVTRHARSIRLILFTHLEAHRQPAPQPIIRVTEPLPEGPTTWPNIDHVVRNWRMACRAIPSDHNIGFVIFDVSTAHGLIPITQTGHLLQLLSTALHLKASDREAFRCSVWGCSHDTWQDMEVRLTGSLFRLGFATDD